MKKANHYEAAFEHLLRERKLPYVAVNEAHRSAFAKADLKSFDFIVYRPDRRNLIVDIKGRKAKPGKKGWLFDPWVGREDLETLLTWQEIFGRSFAATFVFAFWLSDKGAVDLFEPFKFHEEYYRFYAIYMNDFRDYARTRSDGWGTVTIPHEVFRELAWNLDSFFNDLSGENCER
jgi:hypothetical protein